MSEHTDRPRRGRQAEATRNDQRVLDAARDVFAARGTAATVSAIAERAGVGMGSLYRRYGSKDALLRHLCIASMEQSIRAARDALDADDPWQGLTDYVRACVAQGTGALAPLAGTLDLTPQMWDTARRGQRMLERIVARAHRDGRLRPDVTPLDIAWLVEVFGRFVRTDAADQDAVVPRRLLAIVLDGLKAAEADPLPGPVPSKRRYGQRWERGVGVAPSG